MNKDKQMINDLIEIFDEEYGKRYLITPQNTADKLTAKGYRRADEVAREIFEEIEYLIWQNDTHPASELTERIAELKKKYTEEITEGEL